TLLVHPSNPNLLLLTSLEGIYLYRADATSNKWSQPLTLGPALDLVIDPAAPNNVYATLGGSAVGIYHSQDSGAHWAKAVGCPGAALPSSAGVQKITLAFSASTIYGGFKSDQKFEVYRTTGISCLIGGQPERSWERRFTLTGKDANSIWNRLNADPA